jgi:multisubunit Na+/H+ antiporter MnhB subunit
VIILILLLKNSGERYETVKESKVSFSAKLVVILLVFFLIAPLFSILPEFGKPLLEVSERYLESGTEETGAVNLVTSVVLDYRVYDTLGEATILFVSILGVVTLLRKRDKGKDDI